MADREVKNKFISGFVFNKCSNFIKMGKEQSEEQDQSTIGDQTSTIMENQEVHTGLHEDYNSKLNIIIASICFADKCNVRISRTMTIDRIDNYDATIMWHTHISVSHATVVKLSPSTFSLETVFSICVLKQG